MDRREAALQLAQEIGVEARSNEIIGLSKDNGIQLEELPALSLSDLLSHETPLYEWIIQDVIQPKKIAILAGASATCKSWISLAAIFSVAFGKPFLGQFPTSQGSVLFIDRENSLPELQKRTKMILGGMEIRPDEKAPIYFLSEQPFKLDSRPDLAKLELFIKKNNIKLIVGDVYRRLISFEENNADDVSKFFTDQLKPLCERTGCAVLLIHHFKKGKAEGDEKELLRGSSDLVNFVDSIFQVTRKGDLLTVKNTKSRGSKELEPFSLKLETDEDTYYRFSFQGEYLPITALNKAIEAILLWVKSNKISSFKTKEVEDYCINQKVKRSNFYTALTQLEQIGEISKVSRGVYEIVTQKKIVIPVKNQGLDKVQSPLSKRSGLLDIVLPNNPSSIDSPNGQVGLLDYQEEAKELT